MGNQETVSLPTKENIPPLPRVKPTSSLCIFMLEAIAGMFSFISLSDSHKCESSVFEFMARKMPRIYEIAETEVVG